MVAKDRMLTKGQIGKYADVLVWGLKKARKGRFKKGDTIKVRDKSRKQDIIHDSLRKTRDTNILPWLSLDKANLSGVFLEVPNREDIPININENLIVELYSK